MNLPKTYEWTCGHNFSCEFFPPRLVTSRFNARVTAVLLFRRWFGGREPGRSWQWKGNLGKASDRAHRFVRVEQVNREPSAYELISQ